MEFTAIALRQPSLVAPLSVTKLILTHRVTSFPMEVEFTVMPRGQSFQTVSLAAILQKLTLGTPPHLSAEGSIVMVALQVSQTVL
jgi:hypothetical protein